jgi:hypothetical protein
VPPVTSTAFPVRSISSATNSLFLLVFRATLANPIRI